MNPIKFSQSFAAAVANGIALSQGPVNGGTALALNGSLVTAGVAYLDASNKTPKLDAPAAARRVVITSAGNDSGITFVIVGKDRYGNGLTEVIAGGNAAAVTTVNDFSQVSRIIPSGNTASTLTAGTSAVGSSPWFCMDMARQKFEVRIACNPIGTVTYTVEHTYDDPNWITTPWNTTVEANSDVPPTVWKHPTLQNQTVAAEGNYDEGSIFAMRLTTNSGTGTVKFWAIQSGIADS